MAQEIANFNRKKKLFPMMNSINTSILNDIKSNGDPYIGPGTY